jgi:hypothetical protein
VEHRFHVESASVAFSSITTQASHEFLDHTGTSLHKFAISPDGRLVAMAAQVHGKRQLWLRALDAFQT